MGTLPVEVTQAVTLRSDLMLGMALNNMAETLTNERFSESAYKDLLGDLKILLLSMRNDTLYQNHKTIQWPCGSGVDRVTISISNLTHITGIEGTALRICPTESSSPTFKEKWTATFGNEWVLIVRPQSKWPVKEILKSILLVIPPAMISVILINLVLPIWICIVISVILAVMLLTLRLFHREEYVVVLILSTLAALSIGGYLMYTYGPSITGYGILSIFFTSFIGALLEFPKVERSMPPIFKVVLGILYVIIIASAGWAMLVLLK